MPRSRITRSTEWCPTHGDVTACPCRPAPKRFVVALTKNWHQPDFVREVRWSGRATVVLKDRPA